MTESISSSSATPYEQAALKMKDRSIKAKEDELSKKATSVFGGYSKDASAYHYYDGAKLLGTVQSFPTGGTMRSVSLYSTGPQGEEVCNTFHDIDGDGKIDIALTSQLYKNIGKDVNPYALIEKAPTAPLLGLSNGAYIDTNEDGTNDSVRTFFPYKE